METRLLIYCMETDVNRMMCGHLDEEAVYGLRASLVRGI
jgi:hypothetical protein